MIAPTLKADTLVRLAVHFSREGNAGNSFYLDDFSSVILPDVVYSDVTATSLKALAPGLNLGVVVTGHPLSTSIIDRPESKAVIEQHFNQLSSGSIMRQGFLQPRKDVFTYDNSDEFVQYAKDNSLTVHGHGLVSRLVPRWIREFDGDKAAWITMMETHVTTVATHFEEPGDNDTVTSWDVVNEAFMDNGEYRGAKTTTQFNDVSVWYENIGEEFIPRAFIAARAVDPDAELYYNDFNLISSVLKLDSVIDMVNQMQADDVPIDGIGFQSNLSLNNPDISIIKSQFQKVVDLGLKVKITELNVRMNDEDTYFSFLTAARSEEQKQYYHDIVEAYLDIVPVEQRGGITVFGLIDSELQNFLERTREWPLLFNDDFTPKPALQGFADALEDYFGSTDIL